MCVINNGNYYIEEVREKNQCHVLMRSVRERSRAQQVVQIAQIVLYFSTVTYYIYFD